MQPTVTAVILTRDRPEMLLQAIKCVRAQTYETRLLILNSGDSLPPRSTVHYRTALKSIAALRNQANDLVRSDIIAHFDDDDWSHPRRIEEQVALLQASGADAVGYNQMLFWDARPELCTGKLPREWPKAESWLYTGSILGTSLCYWRAAWERNPFRDPSENAGGNNEDADFLLRVKAVGQPSLLAEFNPLEPTGAPRMIARIHAGNASNPAYNRDEMAKYPAHWRRVPEWDAYCSGVFHA
jgi:glycosyltransferase involved in cell wall biosynthesis